MEAIEFAMAEPGASSIEVITATARDVLDGHERQDAILDFCPVARRRIPLDAPLLCVEAEELLSGGKTLVPAELVFLPSPRPGDCGLYFGASSNGLASGNTVLEATVHGLAEAMERDVDSFLFYRNTSVQVPLETLPPLAAALVEAIRRAGLHLQVRYCDNSFRLPFFSAILYDADSASPFYVNAGMGFHPHRSIALLRALCEAVQSRLTCIHGGRDDLVDWKAQHRDLNEHNRAERASTLWEEMTYASETIAYDTAVDAAERAGTLERCFQALVDALALAGIHKICRVIFTQPDDPLHVVKVIVPGLEELNVFSRRVGKRLNAYASRK
jgi:ribosomal protein S12 methylthiotransferase accessory factor